METWEKFYSKTTDLEFLVKNVHTHLDFFKVIFRENPKKVLEVGTGTGSMSIFLSYLGIDVTSIDNDKKVLKNAEDLAKKINGKVRFIFADAFKTSFKNNSFDLVFHQGFFEHFSDEGILKLLDEQLRISKAVVFSVPNNNYPSLDFGNERLLTKEYWDRLISSKFKVISFEYNVLTRTLFSGRINYHVRKTMYGAKVTRK